MSQISIFNIYGYSYEVNRKRSTYRSTQEVFTENSLLLVGFITF